MKRLGFFTVGMLTAGLACAGPSRHHATGPLPPGAEADVRIAGFAGDEQERIRELRAWLTERKQQREAAGAGETEREAYGSGSRSRRALTPLGRSHFPEAGNGTDETPQDPPSLRIGRSSDGRLYHRYVSRGPDGRVYHRYVFNSTDSGAPAPSEEPSAMASERPQARLRIP